MNEKTLSLLKKLKALADHGVDGEKINAQQQLQKFMSKYGVSLDQLEDDAVKAHYFDVKAKDKKLFVQVVVSVCNNHGENIFGHRFDKTKMIVDCSASIAIEIGAKFDFYSREYSKQLAENNKIFYKAFVRKNWLFSDAPSEEKEFSEEELAELRKVIQQMDLIDKAQYYHQLK